MQHVAKVIQLDATSPTGLSWSVSTGGSRIAGRPALTCKQQDGYFRGKVNGKNLFAHRVVYFLAHGEVPEQIDHLDGNRANNTPGNLRASNQVENRHNRLSRGYWRVRTAAGDKYAARVISNGVNRYLGRFASEQEARCAVENARRQHQPTAPERCYD